MHDFISNIKRLTTKEKERLLQIIRLRGEEYNIYPLSSEQKRLWFLYRLNPQDTSYNITFSIEIDGLLNKEALDQSLTELVEKQSGLLTTIFDIDGEAFQVINKSKKINLKIEDLTCKSNAENIFEELVNEEYCKVFNMEEDTPLRMRLIKYSDDRWSLIVVIHHIFCDGWSMGVFCKMLKELYKKNTGEEYDELIFQNVTPYYEYAKYNETRDRKSDIDFWKKNMADANLVTSLPYSYPQCDSVDATSNESKGVINKRNEVLKFCKENRITMFSFLLGIYGLVINKYCFEKNITVGTPLLNRNNEKWKNTVGFFANTIALNFTIAQDDDIRVYFSKINNMVIDSIDHGEFQFDELVDILEVKRNKSTYPVFNSMFALQNNVLFAKGRDNTCGNITMKMMSPEHDSNVQFNLISTIIDDGDILKIDIVGKKGLFSKERIQNIVYSFIDIANKILDKEFHKISQLNSQNTLDDLRNKKILEIESNIREKLLVGSSENSRFNIRYFVDVIIIFSKYNIEESILRQVFNDYIDVTVVVVNTEDDVIDNDFFNTKTLDVYKRIKPCTTKIKNNCNIGFYYFNIIENEIELHLEKNKSINDKYVFDKEIKVIEIYKKISNDIITENERTMIELWKSVLGNINITIHDDFFELGGKSVKMIELFEKINNKYPDSITVNDIFSYPTVHRLTKFITKENNSINEEDDIDIICL